MTQFLELISISKIAHEIKSSENKSRRNILIYS